MNEHLALLPIPPADALDLSVVVPVKNEEGNVLPLIAEIDTALDGACTFEIIYVDDGSTDATPDRLAEAAAAYPRLRRLRHGSSCGQSAAIRTGVLAARGRLVATLDGDGQNPPAELPKLIAPLLAAGASANLGIVAGQRVRRQDSMAKKLASKVGNGVRGALLADGVRDSGCGLKAFRRTAYLQLPYFDHMHRFLPALMRREGFDIALVDVAHRPRASGQSNYGTLDRALVGLSDLMGVVWLRRRRRRTTAITEVTS